MTVSEIIKRLKEMPEDFKVTAFHSYEGENFDIDDVSIGENEVVIW